MMLAKLPKLKALSALLILTLACSVGSAAPAKSRKASARSSKSAKAKSHTRGAKKIARGKSSKADKRNARASKKGRGRGSVARGRHMRSRWRGQVVRSRPTYRRSGIHNYLTEAWANAQGVNEPAADQAPEQVSETASPAAEPARINPGIPAAASPANTDATNLQRTDQSLPEPIYSNPLVAAYAESLAARGFDAENQGFIVETMTGEVLAEHNADRPFNPASVVKIATSLAAISKLGPDFRFRTSLYTDGTLDPSTGVLNGSLYLIGSGDPAFFYENALLIVDKLNRSGIREVNGNLVVLGLFYFNFSASREASARAFRLVLTPDTWNAGVKSAYPRFLSMRAAEDRVNKNNATQPYIPSGASPAWPSGAPSLKINGETITDPGINTSNLHLIAVHTSLSLVHVLKALNDFSNNWMAHVIGDLVGGPEAVKRFLKTEVGFKDEELSLATSSGLGANYISPRGTVHILRKLITYLRSKNLKLEDMLPVAGVDAGTLERRFKDVYRGSVVAKTGTLRSVSALAGVAYTRSRGPLLFVIYNRGGSTYSFRAVQDETIKKVITLFGGPLPVRYSSTPGPRVSEQTPEPEGRAATAGSQR